MNNQTADVKPEELDTRTGEAIMGLANAVLSTTANVIDIPLLT